MCPICFVEVCRTLDPAVVLCLPHSRSVPAWGFQRGRVGRSGKIEFAHTVPLNSGSCNKLGGSSEIANKRSPATESQFLSWLQRLACHYIACGLSRGAEHVCPAQSGRGTKQLRGVRPAGRWQIRCLRQARSLTQEEVLTRPTSPSATTSSWRAAR